MKNHINLPILSEENSRKDNLWFLFTGIAIMIVSAIIYICNYTTMATIISDITNADFSKITFLTFSTMLFVLGLIIAIASLNLNNALIKYTLVFLLGGFSVMLFFIKQVGLAFVLLLISIAIFVIVKVFDKVVCTLLTFIVCSWSIIPIFVLTSFIPKSSLQTTLYISISVFFLLYNVLGVPINRFCLRKIFGHGNEVEQYEGEQLKNQINLMYLISFVIINVCFMYDANDIVKEYANVVNNALLTGVCISNVKWCKVFWNGNDEKENK